MEIFGKSSVEGIGSYIPSTRVQTDELMEEIKSERFGVPSNYISEHIGIVEHRAVERGTTPSYLATMASQSALRDAGMCPDEIDLIVFVGITRDYEEPSTAHNVQKQLGAKRAACMDVSNACLGFMSGLSVAEAYVASGMSDTVMICTGETGSATREAFMPILHSTRDRLTFKKLVGVLTVGDAGGAVIVRKNTSPDRGWCWFETDSDGEHAELCYFTKEKAGYHGQMVMDKICAVTMARHKALFKKARQKIGWIGMDANKTYCHQVGGPAHRMLTSRLGLDPKRAPISYDRYGNLTTATVPVLMDIERPKQGEKLQFFCSGSGISVFQGAMVF